MKQSTKVFLASILSLTILGEPARACNPRCRPAVRAIQVIPPANVVPQQLRPSLSLPPAPTPSPNGLTANDVIINDLPADAKRAIQAAAAKVRTNSSVRQPARFAR